MVKVFAQKVWGGLLLPSFLFGEVPDVAAAALSSVGDSLLVGGEVAQDLVAAQYIEALLQIDTNPIDSHDNLL